MSIKNYGLLWECRNVYWGNPVRGDDGKLLGKISDGVRPRIVNFREQIGLYGLYDNDNQLVYFGYSGVGGIQRLLKRLQQQRTSNRRLFRNWHKFSWFGMKAVANPNEVAMVDGYRGLLNMDATTPLDRVTFLHHVEAIGIAIADPPLNIRRGVLNKAQKYLQHRDPRLD